MSKLKKFAGILLALVMCFGLTCTAFAANIEIQGANVGETYTAYQIFTATQSGDNITYYISSGSAYYGDIVAMSNLASEDQQEAEGYAQLFTLVGPNSDGAYQVTWNTSDNDAIIAYLVSLGAKGTKAGDVTATENEEDGTVSATITDLAAGYYFVTTSTGSVVSIGTTGTEEIQEKNPTPTVDKEETTDGTAGIGDKVEFSVTIKDAASLSNLVYHDTMSEGLTFDSTSVTVTVVTPAEEEGEDDTVVSLTATTDYTVVIPDADDEDYDGCTFEVVFTATGLGKVSEGDSIVITYSATVNENAVIDSTGNTNEGKVSYGDAGESETDKTTTKVYDFDLKKTDGNTELTGAEFTLSDGAETISFVVVNGNYRVATAEEKATEGATTTTISAGTVNISGLDAGTYTLTETKAPDGYNQLSNSLTVTINEDGTVTFSGSTVTTVEIVNEAGSVLPSTGGMGTTIFYVVGGVLVVGAVVLLITKKRMSE